MTLVQEKKTKELSNQGIASYMKRLNKAKDTLLSEKRVEYDETLGESEDSTFDVAGFLAEGITTIGDDHLVV